MSNGEVSTASGPVRLRTIEKLGGNIAAPSVHVGGGSAAAVAGSLAAASAELVVALSVRKSTPPDTAARLTRDRDRLTELRAALLEAADADERVLEELMRVYRARGSDRGPSLKAAAETTLAIARLAVNVVEIATADVEHASRFTVSDLGAAAAIARGAAEAALLTAEVNVRLLVESGDVDSACRWRTEIDELRANSTRAADLALAATRARIDGQGGG